MRLPDGVGLRHIERRGMLRRRASVASLVVLGIVVAFGLSGNAGGKRQHQQLDNDAGTFSLDAPAVSRTGDILATRLRVAARQHIGRLVIGVEPALWHDITNNAMIPNASDEHYADGLVRFVFDKVEAGSDFRLQIAQQINPSLVGGNHGRIVFLDDGKVLAEFNVTLKVLP